MVKANNSHDTKFLNEIASSLALDSQFNNWYLSWAVPEALKLIQLTEIINGLSYVTLTHTGLTYSKLNNDYLVLKPAMIRGGKMILNKIKAMPISDVRKYIDRDNLNRYLVNKDLLKLLNVYLSHNLANALRARGYKAESGLSELKEYVKVRW